MRIDFRRFADGAWLNDECVNFYLGTLVERHVRLSAERVAAIAAGAVLPPLAPIWVVNSHFLHKAMEGKRENDKKEMGFGRFVYRGVKRWSWRAGIDIFACGLILIPINYSNEHWALAVIRPAARTIEVWDSLGWNTGVVFEALLKYIKYEFIDKHPMVCDYSSTAGHVGRVNWV